MYENVLIHSDNGLPVKLRASPSRACAVWWEIPPGTSAVRLGSDGPWSRLETKDGKDIARSGWMLSSFVKSAERSEGEYTPSAPDGSAGPSESTAVDRPSPDPALSSTPSSASLSQETVIRMMAILTVIEKQLDTLYELLGGRD